MRVTFIYLDLAVDDPAYSGYFYHGIAYLSAVLKKAGHQTSLIQLTKEIPAVEFQERIKTLRPDLVGFSSTSHMFSRVKKYAAAAKTRTHQLAVGGAVDQVGRCSDLGPRDATGQVGTAIGGGGIELQ